MPRALWKGAISFGLVHIPVELFAAEKRSELDLDLIDKRDFAPVGYRRVNKATGKEVEWDDIVKGYQYEEGQYVVLTEQELKQANPAATQTLELQAFVKADEIDPLCYEQPYYLTPTRRGEKVYALLRETLRRSGRVGIGQVVIRTRQHLAALRVVDQALVLQTLRYANELRGQDELDLPVGDGISDRELKMAQALVEDLSETWQHARYRDSYQDDVMALVDRKIAANETHAIVPDEGQAEPPPSGGNVVDLVALLKQSLSGKPKASRAIRQAASKKTAVAKPAATRAKAEASTTSAARRKRA
ncbi:Ku protein [Chitinimonas arctica]|uniref:Non-homologous end joining protein Ku n=1 Tax=Chitinimonas arctica TaxID=2594795 RepID=A0A516S9S3_9NEIS|nr:Ku protein [Chitinimonas arctica]QDQ24902.1 Ku protein [Chitinimonas arctica]